MQVLGTSTWIALAALVAASAVLVFLLLRQKRRARRAPGAAPARGVPAREPAGVPPRREAARAAPLRRTFPELTSRPELLRAIEELGWRRPTPLQSGIIPLLASRRDVVAVADRGAGKTGSYLIPALERQADREGLHLLVICPTRELVERVAGKARALARPLHLWVGTLHDGGPAAAQVRDLRAGFDILVATPGRLLEHLEAGNVDLSTIQVLVLDEADRLSDRWAQLERILAALRTDRQTIAFAASLPEPLRDRLQRITRKAEWVEALAPAPGPPPELPIPSLTSPPLPAAAPRRAGLAVETEEVLSTGLTGTVRWFNERKGYGFITPDTGEKDCFVHRSAIPGDGDRSLSEGDRVRFDLVRRPKGPEAENVRRLSE
ncbi:MAG: DEAD/DEAH box helicase [Gemmatimonadetes bacterium]|nr:DEAD/DEAH box helicase [Gemmatimonadota bacterium]